MKRTYGALGSTINFYEPNAKIHASYTIQSWETNFDWGLLFMCGGSTGHVVPQL